MSATGGERVAWVDYAKGICLVGVVALYATIYVEGLALDESWMAYVVEFARPFRMPAFFLVSGLFLARTIDRPWPDYLDKKILHFAYFFVLWTTLYFSAGVLTGEFDGGAPLWADYAGWYIEPFHMLWFIQMLPVYFLATRWVRHMPWIIVLTAAALLQIWAPESGWRQLDRFGERFVYFYAGYMFAPFAFRVADWTRENRVLALIALASWGVINTLFVLAEFADHPIVSLGLGFAGTGAVIAVASLLAGSRPMDWLRYVGEHSIVVFLSFFFVTVIAARLLDTLGIIDDAGTQALLVTALSVALPLLACRLIQPTPLRFLFERPRWAQMRATRYSVPTPAESPRTTQANAPTATSAAGLANPVPPAIASVLPIEPPGPAQVK